MPLTPLPKGNGFDEFMANPIQAEQLSSATEPVEAEPHETGRGKTVTMKDIAKVAGVTSMTVSRVMKGTGYVSPATRETVLRIAAELNFTTNLAGRALKTGRTGTIAVISGSLNQPYNSAVVSLLESQLASSGYLMRLVLNRGDIREFINSTNAASVDGVIVTGLHYVLDEFRAQGFQIRQPAVHICIVKLENEDYVECDLVPAVEEALRHMLDAGRQRIAYVGVGEGLSLQDTEVRTRTYLSAMEKAGRQAELISASPTHALHGFEPVQILKGYLQKHGCPDGLLCMNDDVAIQMYRALMDAGFRIPDDTLLVGCDGLPITAYFEPPISTIAQPLEEMCAQAWKLLQNRMAHPTMPPQHEYFKAQLVVRRSLGN